MALRRNREGLNAWPGYVDALSTLLMVLIFVLLVFVLAQGFLSVALSSRDQALDRLNRQVAELADLLALERNSGEELRGRLSRMTEELRTAAGARDAALAQLGSLRDERDRQSAERDATRAGRDRLAARLADLEASSRGAGERITSLEERLAEALSRAEARGGEAASSVRELTEARRQLAGEREALATARQQLAEQQARAGSAETARDRTAADLAAARAELDRMRQAMAELDRTVQADRATIAAKLSDIARLDEQVRALTALRDELEQRSQAALNQSATTEEARRKAEEEAAGHARLAESARAQIALLTQQVTELRAELSRIAALLDAEEAAGRDKDAQIGALGQRLNAALAARVEELQRYRSDFFGRLRDVLGTRPEVRIVGDRFVFQSEVLFPVGSADLSPTGRQQLRQLAGVLLDVSARFPADLPWILRVDGHADRNPLSGSGRYASNWELSAARAIAVAQLLIGEGLPANHVAAAAFGDNQPLDPGDSPEALARNRRIELRLTDR
ncbi:peptidoglycan -binding protein [Pseudoroseomonas ludipueritiae]|uniref:Peptidoglycan -binding protein n=1 Tax=Pseudoroseomonas ludipueritiae TaxID=198093 RepID=A0ABR7R8B5_9PROT|nr:peptidoglycan -binding protein [Pseudoroseomonas ludipueritiae]MBC9178060.1 peptidoglycan -binding protein [Pseudoroseomonas ludipueritiae]